MTGIFDNWTIETDASEFEINLEAPDGGGAAAGEQALYYRNNDEDPQLITADASDSHSNVRLEYACIADETSNTHGLAFGHQDNDNYYSCVITSSGYHSQFGREMEVHRYEEGSQTRLVESDSLGSVPGDPEDEWFDVRIDIWDVPDGIACRAHAGERDPDNPFDDDVLEPISQFTIANTDFIDDEWTPGKVGLTFADGGDNPLWVDDIRLYTD